MKIFTAALAFALLMPSLAHADGIKYAEDPVYEKINKDDPHPMDDMIALAKEGDLESQFVLGDMFEKGKGGLAKNLDTARNWFETSARNGYPFAFIRLAAMAKNAHQPVKAYEWYTLAEDNLPSGSNMEWAKKSRDQLVADAKMTPEEIAKATQDAKDWYPAAEKQHKIDVESYKAQVILDAQKEKEEQAETVKKMNAGTPAPAITPAKTLVKGEAK